MLEVTTNLPKNVNYVVKRAFILPLLENLPTWISPKTKPKGRVSSKFEIMNKVRNSVVLFLAYCPLFEITT